MLFLFFCPSHFRNEVCAFGAQDIGNGAVTKRETFRYYAG